MTATPTRRQFGQGASALVLAFSLAPRFAFGQAASLPGSLANNRMLDAWLRINADGSATIFAGKVELGQGILTALQQIAAEELELPLARVEMISGDTARTPDEAWTAGSQSIEYGGTAIRLACAEARALLLDQAAKQLNAVSDTLSVAEGVVSAPDGRRVGYGELAATVDLHREATAKVAPKPPARHTIVGHSILRHDIPAKVTGGAAYVQDIRLPGMAHGRVVRPPRYGAKLESVDEAGTRTLPGVVAVVRDGSFIGVVAEREEQAIKARAALIGSAKWSGGTEMPDPARLYDYLMALPTQSSVVSEKQATVPAGAKTIEAIYTRPYQAHASIGPSCAVAEFKDGKLTVWTHSQGVFPLRRDLVKALKMDASAVRCIHVEGSGCYGHNGADDVALDAALLARAAGRPVRLQWMRDDEFAWEPYGSAMLARAKASLDASGRIVDWNYEVWSNTHLTRPNAPGTDNNLLASWYLADPSKPGPATNIPQPAGGGDRNAVPLYDFPNQRIVNHLITRDAAAGVGAAHAWRLRQRVRSRIVHGRAGGRGRSGSGRVPAGAYEGPARPRGDRGGRQEGRLEGRREGRRHPRPRHRIREIQEPLGLRGGGGGRGSRSQHGCNPRAPRLRGDRCRPDHQSRRPDQPDRRRYHPVDQLDPARSGPFRSKRHHLARLEQLSDPDDAGSAEGRGRVDRSAERETARLRRGLAGTGGGGHRQRVRACDRQEAARPAVQPRARQDDARIGSLVVINASFVH